MTWKKDVEVNATDSGIPDAVLESVKKAVSNFWAKAEKTQNDRILVTYEDPELSEVFILFYGPEDYSYDHCHGAVSAGEIGEIAEAVKKAWTSAK